MLLGSILTSQQQMGGPLSQVRPESGHEPTIEVKMKDTENSTQLNPFLRNSMKSYCTTWDLCRMNMLKEVLSDHLFWS